MSTRTPVEGPERLINDAEVARRYLDGESGISIARALGFSAPGIYISLHRSGVEIRSRVTTVRGDEHGEDELRCGTCREWKPKHEFCRGSGRSNIARGGRHRHCRPCQTKARAERRIRNSVVCGGCGEKKKRPDPYAKTDLCADCYEARNRAA